MDGVSFSVGAGKTTGLVGESGSGKTAIRRALIRLIPSSGGKAVFEGRASSTCRSGISARCARRSR
ncbi:MAG: ATP-binding cassette domain-containing protein [Verrucomicrobiales bacterium]